MNIDVVESTKVSGAACRGAAARSAVPTFVIVLLCGCITLMVPTSAVLAEGLWPVGGGCDGRGFRHAIDARS